MIDAGAGFRLHDVLRPAFSDGVTLGFAGGVLAVIVLDEPESCALDELELAARLHAYLERGVLVVI